MLAGFREVCCLDRDIFGVPALLSNSRQQSGHWNVMRIGNPSIFMCRADLVESKWGRTVQVSKTEARVKVM